MSSIYYNNSRNDSSSPLIHENGFSSVPSIDPNVIPTITSQTTSITHKITVLKETIKSPELISVALDKSHQELLEKLTKKLTNGEFVKHRYLRKLVEVAMKNPDLKLFPQISVEKLTSCHTKNGIINKLRLLAHRIKMITIKSYSEAFKASAEKITENYQRQIHLQLHSEQDRPLSASIKEFQDKHKDIDKDIKAEKASIRVNIDSRQRISYVKSQTIRLNENKINELNAKIDTHTQKKSQVNEKIEIHKRKLNEIEKNISRYTKTDSKSDKPKSEKIREIEEGREKVKAEYVLENNKVSTELKSLEEEANQFDNEITSFNEELTTLKAETNTLKGQVNLLENEISTLRDESSKLDAADAKLRALENNVIKIGKQFIHNTKINTLEKNEALKFNAELQANEARMAAEKAAAPANAPPQAEILNNEANPSVDTPHSPEVQAPVSAESPVAEQPVPTTEPSVQTPVVTDITTNPEPATPLPNVNDARSTKEESVVQQPNSETSTTVEAPATSAPVQTSPANKALPTRNKDLMGKYGMMFTAFITSMSGNSADEIVLYQTVKTPLEFLLSWLLADEVGDRIKSIKIVKKDDQQFNLVINLKDTIQHYVHQTTTTRADGGKVFNLGKEIIINCEKDNPNHFKIEKGIEYYVKVAQVGLRDEVKVALTEITFKTDTSEGVLDYSFYEKSERSGRAIMIDGKPTNKSMKTLNFLIDQAEEHIDIPLNFNYKNRKGILINPDLESSTTGAKPLEFHKQERESFKKEIQGT